MTHRQLFHNVATPDARGVTWAGIYAYSERGSTRDNLSYDDLRDGLYKALARLGSRQRVLVVPPDFTRFIRRRDR